MRAESGEQQVETEIGVASASAAIAGMLGLEYRHDYRQDSAGTAGKMVVDLAELDGIIKDLKNEADEINKDGDRLAGAIGMIEPPAEDVMSRRQADATRESLLAARAHNERMFALVEAEIAKLVTVRNAYAQSEETNAANLRKPG